MIVRSSTKIDVAAAAGRSFVPYLKRMLPRAVALVTRCRLASLSVALVGDVTMSRLHERFLSIAGPTDVLTFELDHDARGRCVAGEVIVCVPEARRQSRRLGTRVERELLLYALHGVLHLSGYDDLDADAHRRMHDAEDRILTLLNVGPVFRVTPPVDHVPPRKRTPLRKRTPRR